MHQVTAGWEVQQCGERRGVFEVTTFAKNGPPTRRKGRAPGSIDRGIEDKGRSFIASRNF